MFHAAPDPAAHAVIILSYIAFAVQLTYQAGGSLLRSAGGRSIALLVTVFVLCAFTGYGADLVPLGPTVETWAHYLLALAGVALVLSNQAGAAAAMIAHERGE